MTAYTIGHSSRTADEFVALLTEHGICRLVDVRRHPGSRQHPHFNREALGPLLNEAGIAYRHEPRLGGRRVARADSRNTAWRQSGFRGFADWMASPEFHEALDRLAAELRIEPVVVMCAESDPTQCHRFLLADAIVSIGFGVRHIVGPSTTQAHTLHSEARVETDGTLVYPGSDPQIGLI